MGKLFMKSLLYLCVSCMAILMPFGLTSCAADDELAEYKEYDGGGIKSFTSFTATLDEVAGTRAYLDAEATNGIRRVHWEEGDVVSVYSDINPTLKKFVLTGIDENGVGTFTGEKITGNYFYAVFAPGKEITVDASDPDVVHLKGAVFNKNMMADQGTAANFTAPMVAATAGSSFSFKQTTGLVKITVGNVHQVDDLFFRGNKLEPIGEDYLVDMSEDKPVLKLNEGANIVSHDQIITDLDDKFVDVYFTLPPMVFENGFLLTITGVDAQGKEFELDKSYNSRFEVKAGSISSFSLVDVSAELEAQGSDEIIVFADPEVKQICVENWDTNGDGELSYKEAAAVTEIGQIFLRNADIKSFDEFQYFTGVTSIGYGAFRGCSSLTSMIIPEGVTSIGNSAFLDCSSLNSIVIPKSVMLIGTAAFVNCDHLKSIMIPEGVASIAGHAFDGCLSLTSIVIPKSVMSIGTAAFQNCDHLKSIMIPEGVTYIGSNAFYGCSSLASIEIPKSVTSIGETAFSGCSSLASIVIPEGVTSIGDYAFHGCSKLTSIVIPEGVASIENFAFDGCLSLTSLVIPKSVMSIGTAAFQECTNLTSIMIPEGVTYIAGGAFSGCISLTSIKVDKNNSFYDSREDCNAIIDTGSNKLVLGCASTLIPESVTSIGSFAFQGCSNLTSIVIPEGVTSIFGYAFSGCSSLESIVIPEGVTSIGDGAFGWCSSLASIVIPRGVTSIGYQAFRNCSNLTSIVIPEGVTSIEGLAFQGCSNLTSVEIPEGVTSIGNSAFSGCSSLTSIVIPEGVTSIGDHAFWLCSSLASIVIHEDVISIGNGAFSGCSSLTSIVIPEGVTSIGNGAFDGCSSLTSIVIPEGVTSIGNGAFGGCSSLTSMVIPKGVTSIGSSVFEGCSSLTSITCLVANPPFYDNVFGEDYGYSYSGTIYVPAASVEAYKAAYGWSNYASQIQAIQE